MRILILTNFDPSDLKCGYSLLARRAIMCFAKTPGYSVSLAVLGGEGSRERKELMEKLARPGGYDALDILPRKGAPDGAPRAYRSLMGAPLSACEKKALVDIAERSGSVDLIIWYSHGCDPVSSRLAKHCKCPVIFFAIDSLTRYESARRDRDMVKYLSVPAIRKYERSVFTSGYSGIIFAAGPDAQAARRVLGGKCTVPVHVLTNGVDTEHFCPKDNGKDSASREPTLLLTGAMNSVENAEAAENLVKEILPRLKKRVSVRIAGRDPSRRVRSLEKTGNRVTVTGMLSDLLEEYRNADIFVAPLLSGTGFKNKIAEALSCGLPVVATPRAASFLREKCDGVIVAGGSERMAAAIDRLLEDPGEIARLGKKAALYARKHFSWDNWDKELIKIVEGTPGGNRREGYEKSN